MTRTYLDYNATAPLRPEARAAMLAALEMVGNPSAVHAEGRVVRGLVEAARDDIAAFVGSTIKDATISFTSGGTEACNLALRLSHAPAGDVGRLIVSAIEHSAVREAVTYSGLPYEILPVLGDGVVDLAALDGLLDNPRPALICVMLANNETGIIQPIAQIARRTQAHGSLLFCDGVQAGGKMPINMAELGCDALSLSAHKLGGPTGIGALITRAGLVVPPLLRGGGQEQSRRAGTENISGIAGFAAAARACDLAGLENLARQRDDMENALKAIAPICIFGETAPRLPNTSNFAPDYASPHSGSIGLDAQTQLMALDLAGVAVSAGAACSSGKVARSHVLAAMGVEDRLAKAALRVSLGWQSTPQDTEKFIATWGNFMRQHGVDASHEAAE